MQRVRIAVVGAGVIGRRHIEEIGRSHRTTLCAIADIGDAAATLAARLDVPRRASLGEMLARDAPDGVVIATPNALHVAQGLECVAAGVPALVEKPIATSVAEGRTLCEAAERAGVALLIGHHRLHSPIVEKTVEVVRSGVLGRIVAVQGSATFMKPEDYFTGANAWRTGPGGGPILINLIHEIGNLRAFVGEIASVQAFTSNATRGHGVEDTAVVNLRFENGALGTFVLSDTAASPHSWEQTARENLAYASYDEDAYWIAGTSGSLAVPSMRMHRYERSEDRSWMKPFDVSTFELERADPLARQIEHFADVIRGACAPRVSARDGLENLRVLEAIRDAAASGCAVSLRPAQPSPQ